MHSKDVPSIAKSCPLAKRVLAFVDKAVTRYVPIAPRRSVLKGLLRRFVQVTVPGLFLSLAACGGNVDPNIQLNPAPAMRHEVFFTVNDPTVTFDNVEAFASYQVTNEACVAKVPISGDRFAPTDHVPLNARKVDKSTYSVIVVGDLLRDEDYFGLGFCHWSLMSVSLIGHKGASELGAGILGTEIYSGAESLTYYPKAWDTYGRHGFAESGSSTISSYRDPESVFTISVRGKEIAR